MEQTNAEPGSDGGNWRAETQKLRNLSWKAGAAFKFLTLRDLRRRDRAWVALYTRESCEMHEMMKGRSRSGASVNQTPSTQAKGNLRQLKLGAAHGHRGWAGRKKEECRMQNEGAAHRGLRNGRNDEKPSLMRNERRPSLFGPNRTY